MKGVIFTKFLEMVDDRFSPELTEEIVERAKPASGGAYTSVGAYDHSEILSYVTLLSEATDTDVATLAKTFGRFLFSALAEAHPAYLDGITDCFDMIEHIDDHIHVEVRKIYPDAELPRIVCVRPDPKTLIVIYRSTRPFADLAEGLLAGCIDYFDAPVELKRLATADDGCQATFELKKTA